MESKQPKNIVDGTPPRNSAKIRRDENIHSPQQPKTLSQEFQLVNFENVSLDEVCLCNHVIGINVDHIIYFNM